MNGQLSLVLLLVLFAQKSRQEGREGSKWSLLTKPELGLNRDSIRDRTKRDDHGPGTFDEVQQQFCSNVEEAIALLRMNQKGEILLHTNSILESENVIIDLTKAPFEARIYTNFMTLSHLVVTAVTILLPDLLESNYALPKNFSNSSTYARMESFQESLRKFNGMEGTSYYTDQQNTTVMEIIAKVSTFVSDALLSPSTVDIQYLQRFINGLDADLRNAARFAVEDYYTSLNRAIEMINPKQWSVVVAVEEFSYLESFLVQYYEGILETSYPERIVLMPQLSCNASELAINIGSMNFSTVKAAVASDTFSRKISELFNDGVLNSPHLILSNVARDIICSGALNFTVPESCSPKLEGFRSRVDRLYVILIVLFLSTTIIFFIIVLSVFCEDRFTKMENKSLKTKFDKLKGPSLLTPISEQDYTSSYSAYRQLRKKCVQDSKVKNTSGIERQLDNLEGTTSDGKSHTSNFSMSSGVSLHQVRSTTTEITVTDN